jgi:hypothetical protein
LNYGLKNYVNVAVEWVGGATPTAYFYDSAGTELSNVVLGDRSLTELLAIFEQHNFKAEVENIVYPDDPVAVKEYGGHTYKFWSTDNYFPAAQEYVAAKHPDGYVVTITSKAEQEFLGSALKELGIKKAWLGAKDIEEGKWQWLGGPEKDQVWWDGYSKDEEKSKGYTLWFPNEPNNIDNEDCAIFFPDGWNDASCDTEKAALVVEFGNDPQAADPAPVPASAATPTKDAKPDL